MPDREWVQAGARVALVEDGFTPRVWFRTITKLTATQIVLDNGDRYNLQTLHPVGESRRSSWSVRTEIMDPNSGLVRDVLAVQKVRKALHAIGSYEDRGHNPIRTAADAEAALKNAEGLIARARHAIINLDKDGDGE